ncbi:MAG: glycosyltransferase [Mycobacterium sp.]|nr:glycosyltransferase [Mycobacterium sp.]
MTSAAPAVTVVVLAKEPVPGRVKTRLTPPYTPAEAAALAEAALLDTLETVQRFARSRTVLCLEGRPWPALPAVPTVLPQVDGGLDRRIAAALRQAAALHAGPVLLVGMDTPQLRPAILHHAAEALLRPGGPGAVLGPAADGGWWLLGLRVPADELVLGVPMSTDHTGADQLRRLESAGLTVQVVEELTDVDDAGAAAAVAAAIPDSRFALALQALGNRNAASGVPA